MNLFQYLALPVTGGLLIWNLIRFVRGKQSRVIALLGSLIWLVASIAILSPELTMRVAAFLGIGRGADLVLYLLAIAFLIAIFYIYQRFQRLESTITQLVRKIALMEASEIQARNDDDAEQK